MDLGAKNRASKLSDDELRKDLEKDLREIESEIAVYRKRQSTQATKFITEMYTRRKQLIDRFDNIVSLLDKTVTSLEVNALKEKIREWKYFNTLRDEINLEDKDDFRNQLPLLEEWINSLEKYLPRELLISHEEYKQDIMINNLSDEKRLRMGHFIKRINELQKERDTNEVEERWSIKDKIEILLQFVNKSRYNNIFSLLISIENRLKDVEIENTLDKLVGTLIINIENRNVFNLSVDLRVLKIELERVEKKLDERKANMKKKKKKKQDEQEEKKKKKKLSASLILK
jgi:hypothetical protein